MPQSREPRIVGALGGTDNRMSLWSRCHATRVSRSGEQPAVETRRGNIAPINPGPSCVFHPSPTAPRLFPGTGTVDEAWKTRRLRCAFEGGSRIATAASGGTSPESNGRWSARRAVPEEGAGRNIARFISVPSCVFHPSPTAPRLILGDRRRGRSVENAPPAVRFPKAAPGSTAPAGGTSPQSNGRWSARRAVPEEGDGRNIARFNVKRHHQETDPPATRIPTPPGSTAPPLTGYPRSVHGDDPRTIKSRWAEGG